MQQYESFGECLKRCLQAGNLSASEAARLVGFRSRNSMFRILAGDASNEVKLRFLESLHKTLGDQWPTERWMALEEALTVERLGPERYRANRAFQRVLHEKEPAIPEFLVNYLPRDGKERTESLADILAEVAESVRTEVIMTGSCDSGLARLLVDKCGGAGAKGTLFVRHYIDTAGATVSPNILGVLPLVSKPWYNARLVAPGSCPPEMTAIYRMQALITHCGDEHGNITGRHYIRYDERNFIGGMETQTACPAVPVLDRWRFHLELLKPMPQLNEGAMAFVDYTERYVQLEDNCTILSIKPDVHFCCIPTALLEQAVIEGFQNARLTGEQEFAGLMDTLRKVHDRRVENIYHKRKPTHLVYSLPAMECFMRTGVTSDHFFLQRAYTVEERRQIIRQLLEAMRNLPYFNIHFMKAGAPPLHYEISCYGDKGVMLTDAYTDYDLDTNHSEALITLPAFIEDFRRYFQEELLPHHVLSRGETLQALERLLVMNIQE